MYFVWGADPLSDKIITKSTAGTASVTPPRLTTKRLAAAIIVRKNMIFISLMVARAQHIKIQPMMTRPMMLHMREYIMMTHGTKAVAGAARQKMMLHMREYVVIAHETRAVTGAVRQEMIALSIFWLWECEEK
jgi:hypothetical protein